MTAQDDANLIAQILMYVFIIPITIISVERLITYFSNPITLETMTYAIQPMLLGAGLCLLAMGIMIAGMIIDSYNI